MLGITSSPRHDRIYSTLSSILCALASPADRTSIVKHGSDV